MRYEIKYQIALVDRYMIEQAIINHPASFSEAFPNRLVNNIYYDTPDLQSFYQNVDGDPNRRKIRFRWYNNDALKTGRLEFKKKRGALGYKEYPEIKFSKPSDLDEAVIKASQSNVTPFLINQYKRSYYLSQDQNFRITIDQDILFKNPQFPVINDFESSIILEIKFDQKDFVDFSKIHNYLPFRQTKYSKYVNGVVKLMQ